MQLHRTLWFLSAVLLVFGARVSPLHAADTGIQMLPPVEFDYSTVCKGTSAGLLYWDGQHPITCIPGSSGDANGNITTAGMITPGSATTGTPCTVYGAMAYDANTDSVVYCSKTTSTWASTVPRIEAVSTTYYNIDTNDRVSYYAYCPPGKHLTGGGCTVGNAVTNLIDDGPANDSTWLCVANGGYAGQMTVTAYCN